MICVFRQAFHLAGLPALCYLVMRTQDPQKMQRYQKYYLIFFQCLHLSFKETSCFLYQIFVWKKKYLELWLSFKRDLDTNVSTKLFLKLEGAGKVFVFVSSKKNQKKLIM